MSSRVSRITYFPLSVLQRETRAFPYSQFLESSPTLADPRKFPDTIVSFSGDEGRKHCWPFLTAIFSPSRAFFLFKIFEKWKRRLLFRKIWCIYGDITNAKCEHLANFSPVITSGKANFGNGLPKGLSLPWAILTTKFHYKLAKNLTNTTAEASNISKSVNIHNLWLHNLIKFFSFFLPPNIVI